MEFKPDFFKGEIRDGFYIEPMMKCAWAVQMDVLEDIQKLCRANILQTEELCWGQFVTRDISHGMMILILQCYDRIMIDFLK